MQAQIDRFSRAASDRVLPDRRCQAVCSGQFLASTPPKAGLRPGPTAIQYRRVITRTGELDGAKDTDGG
jgi:hypothetical protein